MRHFNPRTREGCDKIYFFVPLRANNFNPRTREGCDQGPAAQELDDSQISIHAPVKGATIAFTMVRPIFFYFNPRTREGCDPFRLSGGQMRRVFQSTHP